MIIFDWYFKREVDAVTLSLEQMAKYGEFNCPLINPEAAWSSGPNRLITWGRSELYHPHR